MSSEMQADENISKEKIKKHHCDIIVIFFCGTTGNNSAELLGSDESDIVVVVWQLIDLNRNQVSNKITVSYTPEILKIDVVVMESWIHCSNNKLIGFPNR